MPASKIIMGKLKSVDQTSDLTGVSTGYNCFKSSFSSEKGPYDQTIVIIIAIILVFGAYHSFFVYKDHLAGQAKN